MDVLWDTEEDDGTFEESTHRNNIDTLKPQNIHLQADEEHVLDTPDIK